MDREITRHHGYEVHAHQVQTPDFSQPPNFSITGDNGGGDGGDDNNFISILVDAFFSLFN
ncbi:MAG: hypothetical protein F6K41_07160 [Symploca sp. SIO3E6]|nr:hypothetical protein [Caldora sp. SIO3E6]